MARNRMKCRARPTASGPAHSPLAASTAVRFRAPIRRSRFGKNATFKARHSSDHASRRRTDGRPAANRSPQRQRRNSQGHRRKNSRPARSLARSFPFPVPSPVPPNCLPACPPAFPPSSCGISPLCPKVVSFIKTPSSLARSLGPSRSPISVLVAANGVGGK